MNAQSNRLTRSGCSGWSGWDDGGGVSPMSRVSAGTARLRLGDREPGAEREAAPFKTPIRLLSGSNEKNIAGHWKRSSTERRTTKMLSPAGNQGLGESLPTEESRSPSHNADKERGRDGPIGRSAGSLPERRTLESNADNGDTEKSTGHWNSFEPDRVSVLGMRRPATPGASSNAMV